MKPSLPDFCRLQYDFVCSARSVLLDFCQSLPPDLLVAMPSGFVAGSSMRDLLVHNTHAYAYWIGVQALKQDITFVLAEEVGDLQSVRRIYRQIDDLMSHFLDWMEQSEQPSIQVHRRGEQYDADAFKVFTHVITHEFHHKGQILAMARNLGMRPVDTDVMRDGEQAV